MGADTSSSSGHEPTPALHETQPSGAGRTALAAPLAPGRQIAGYTLIEAIGRGGMGVVFRAEQTSPRRTVAVKLIRSDLASPDLLRRFQYEAHILGRLQHVGIAQIHEAGTADLGDGVQPYFAMEFVSGKPLTVYALDRRLDIRARLELFARVCDAVQHAHLRGIIHRDLKPANILVTEDGQPKVLDFGVARATDGDVAMTVQTSVGQLMGTLPYMSPEQIAGDPREVDARSDVYSLGVALYELLTGRRPYDFPANSIAAALDVIRTHDPQALGTINPRFRGDIETIVAHALAREKSRRYQSAGDLAADIRRHLANEPIAARPATLAYQFWKFARRHRATVWGGAAVLVALLVGVIATTAALLRAWEAEHLAESRFNEARIAREDERQQRVVAQAERGRAETAAAESESVSDFLTQMLASVDPSQGSREMTVREVLDRAASGVAGAFAERPQVAARIQDTIGRSYMGLGLLEPAATHLMAALEYRARELGDIHRDTVASLNNVATVRQLQGQLEEAEKIFRRSLDAHRKVYGDRHGETLTALNNLALVLYAEGRYADAEPLLREALAGLREVAGDEDKATLDTMTNLATVLQTLGKFDDAELLARESLKIRRRIFGDSHPGTLIAVSNLGTLLAVLGRLDEARPYYIETLELSRKVLGEDHPDTLMSLANMAGLLRDLGQLDEAERMYRATLEARRRALGDDHPDTIDTLTSLGLLLLDLGRGEEAAALLRGGLAAAERSLAADQPDRIAATYALGLVLAESGKAAEAEPLLVVAVAAGERIFGTSHWKTARYRAAYGSCLLALGRLDAAERELLAAHAVLRAERGTDHRLTLRTAEQLAKTYRALGRPDEAQRWQPPASAPSSSAPTTSQPVEPPP